MQNEPPVRPRRMLEGAPTRHPVASATILFCVLFTSKTIVDDIAQVLLDGPPSGGGNYFWAGAMTAFVLFYVRRVERKAEMKRLAAELRADGLGDQGL